MLENTTLKKYCNLNIHVKIITVFLNFIYYVVLMYYICDASQVRLAVICCRPQTKLMLLYLCHYVVAYHDLVLCHLLSCNLLVVDICIKRDKDGKIISVVRFFIWPNVPLCLGPIGDFCIRDGEMYIYTRDTS